MHGARVREADGRISVLRVADREIADAVTVEVARRQDRPIVSDPTSPVIDMVPPTSLYTVADAVSPPLKGAVPTSEVPAPSR
jgi:hypothetical protein